ncbi:MAG: helix-turn-helix domain-containing protein [Pelobacteraceae bacterium]
MPQEKNIQKADEMKAGKADINAIMDDAPLFAGLDDYILKQSARMKEAIPKKAKEKTKSKKKVSAVNNLNTPATSGRSMPKNTPKQRKTPTTEISSMLYSVAEMCALLKISRATLVRMDKSGQLPGRIKLGGSVRFHRETVENWLQSLISTPTPP